MRSLLPVQCDLRTHGDPTRAQLAKRFFKTEPGAYGAGDQFIGITVPMIRRVARGYRDLSLRDLSRLLQSPIHEDRLAALIILVDQFRHATDRTLREKIFLLYLHSTRFINNWDLVDTSAPAIVGARLFSNPDRTLDRLARSSNLWERRIAIIATFHFIRLGNPRPTLRIARMLLRDPHDLIHKATGWMLREIGKQCGINALTSFLDREASHMPRTMLRYAIERLTKPQRKKYLQIKNVSLKK